MLQYLLETGAYDVVNETSKARRPSKAAKPSVTKPKAKATVREPLKRSERAKRPKRAAPVPKPATKNPNTKKVSGRKAKRRLKKAQRRAAKLTVSIPNPDTKNPFSGTKQTHAVKAGNRQY